MNDNCLIAANNRQLGLCLRMLLAEDIQGNVITHINNKGKAEFFIYVNTDSEHFEVLKKRYKMIIS